jgi:hypothetical protein
MGPVLFQYFSSKFQWTADRQKTSRPAVEKNPTLNSIQLIGTSVGAFAADAATTETKSMATGEVPYVQLKLLDPFTQRGINDFGYGNRTFGKSPDYVEPYLNTDDPVPSSTAAYPAVYTTISFAE